MFYRSLYLPPISAHVPGAVPHGGRDVPHVSFGVSSTATSPVVLRFWAVPEKIPTTLLLPCYGTGTVTFNPYPTSSTARAATVQVTFVGQPWRPT